MMPLRVAIILYGGWIGNTGIPLSRPDPTVDLTPHMNGSGVKVLYVVRALDHLIDETERGQVAAALTSANVEHEIVVLKGVKHGFMFPDRPSFDEQATETTWTVIVRTI